MKYCTLITLLFSLTMAPIAAGAQERLHRAIDTLNAKAASWLTKPDSLTYYAEKAYEMAQRSTYGRGRAQAAKLKGISAFYQSDFDLAKSYYLESLAEFGTLNDSLEIAKANYNVATVMNAKADYKETLTYGLKALAFFEAIGDHNGEGRVYNLLGIAANVNNDFEKSITYLKQYYQLVKRVPDSLEMATALNNLGSTFTTMGLPDSAIHYLNSARKMNEKIGTDRNMASIYSNLGAMYEAKDDLHEAIAHTVSGLRYARAEGDRLREAGLLFNLGKYKNALGQTQESIPHFIQAIDISEAIGFFEVIYKANNSLAKVRADQGRHAEAYQHMLAVETAKDSVFVIEKMKSERELEARFQSEKKEQQIEILNQETAIQQLKLRQRNLMLIATLALLVTGAVTAYFVFKQRRLQAEARLQHEINTQQEKATRDVLDAEERERRRIAGDLHDGVGQTLSAALLNLNYLYKSVAEGKAPDPQLIDTALGLVKDSYQEMRSISHQMMPNALLKAGLATSIKEFLDPIDGKNIKVYLNVSGLNERLDQQLETVLYRAIQEAVNNVVKHAGATRLTIQILKDEEGLSVSIEDNGGGFDPSSAGYEEGIGLKNIRSRVALLRGSVDVDSAVGRGTVVVIYIPA